MNILIVGVGGQGTLLASKFLGFAALRQGKDVKVSEVHGMSQRGGSVVTCVKIGEAVNSPIIEEGEADVILAFELLEAARWLPYLKKGGTIIANTQKINPMPVISGKAKYPEDLTEYLNTSDANIILLDALKIAEECGSSKAVNVVLLGVLSSTENAIEEEIWLDSLKAVVPPKFLDINIKAFNIGRNYHIKAEGRQ
jgi:indolepyruvate ferredoxin oxidoreductase beta subunit